MKTKKEICGTVFMVLGTLLLVICLLLVLHNHREDGAAQDFASTQLAMIQQSIFQRVSEAEPDVEDTEAESDVGDAEAAVESYGKMPVVFIDGYGYIGYVTFPSLDLELPVMDEGDEARLKLAPCRYYGSLQTNDLVIAGHNYRSGFGKMRDLSEGDEVYFTDMDGVIYSYRVEEIETLNSTDVTKMIASGWDFSLYTCNYDGSRRLTIRCAKVEP